MSRTIRRKNYVPDWVGTDWQKHDDIYVDVRLTGKEYKKALAKYHRCTHVGYGNNGHAPKEFNKMLNRSKRAKMKSETRRIQIQGDYDEYQFDKWVKDAGWHYW